MTESVPEVDPEFTQHSIRALWDVAADPYVAGQAAGLDYYRYEFFGPAQVAMCGDVAGLRLVDVGCGSGYFAREMAARGARVTGVDISGRMIEHARRIETENPLGIEYVVADAADLRALGAEPFDMATSCLALQDMPAIGRVFQSVRSVLRAGGRFVPSISHPCSDTPFRAWERDEFRRKRWLCIDRYFEEGPIKLVWQRWGTEFTTMSYHATIERWVDWIIGAGFEIRALREPRPTEHALLARPDLEDAGRVPYYIMWDLVSAVYGGPSAP